MKPSIAMFFCGLLSVICVSRAALSKRQHVVLADSHLFVGGEPFIVKGVCWNPILPGETFPAGLPWFAKGFDEPLNEEDRTLIVQDLQLMKEAGINTVRTYLPIVNLETLELLKKFEIYQIVPTLNFYKVSLEDVKHLVDSLKSHPTTLFWELGNEWNYNRLYSEGSHHLSLSEVTDKLVKAGNMIRQMDPYHPISTSYGELPYFSKEGEDKPGLLSKKDFQRIDGVVDAWGLNVYSGDTFKNSQGTPRAVVMKELSHKPIYFSEYGADAFNAHGRSIDEDAQAFATYKLTKEIVDELAWQKKGGNVLGGTIFEFSDEWWKAPGAPEHHDEGGHAPGGGPHPDGIFNEEFWGVVTIDREPRKAYFELAKIYKSLP